MEIQDNGKQALLLFELAHFEAFSVASESHRYDLQIFHRFPWMILRGLYKKRRI